MTLPRTFTLQPVLTLKEQREEQLQLTLATRLTAEEEARGALARLHDERDRQLRALEAVTCGPLDLTTLDSADSYLDYVAGRLVEQTAAADEATAATLAARDALKVAAQERKALEQLREQQRAALRRHVNRLEAGQADETAISRHVRRTRGA